MGNWGIFTLLIGVTTYNPIYNWFLGPPFFSYPTPILINLNTMSQLSRISRFRQVSEDAMILASSKAVVKLSNESATRSTWKTQSNNIDAKEKKGSVGLKRRHFCHIFFPHCFTVQTVKCMQKYLGILALDLQ